MKKVIVTGADGFIGSNLIKNLSTKGIEIIGIVREGKKIESNHSDNLKFLECNLKDISNLPEIIKFRDFDTFYHFAWEGSNGIHRNDYELQSSNSIYALHAAKSAKLLGCKRFISTGSLSENLFNVSNIQSSKNSPYGIAKNSTRAILQSTCKQLKISFVWAQLSNTYGVRNETGNLLSYTIDNIIKKRRASFGPCNQYYDLVNIFDVANILYLIGESSNVKSFYFVGSGEPRLLKHYLIELGEIFECPDLIGIGDYEDDGLIYKKSWFNINDIKNDFSYNISKSFSSWMSDVKKYHLSKQ